MLGPATIEHPRDQRRSDVDPSGVSMRTRRSRLSRSWAGSNRPSPADARKIRTRSSRLGGLSVMAEDDTDPVAITYLVELRLLHRLRARGPHESDRPGGHALERRRRFRARPHDPLVRNLAADSNGKSRGCRSDGCNRFRGAPAGPLERFGHVPSQGVIIPTPVMTTRRRSRVWRDALVKACGSVSPPRARKSSSH